MAASRTVHVAGGAGFIGSHLADRLLAEGCRVVALDNFLTGSRANVAHLADEPRFSLVEADVRDPIRLEGKFDEVWNLASPASPVHYQKDPIATLLTNVLGTEHLLAFAEAQGARYLQASTSEVYGDPALHPQPETYWGNVNPIGVRACYDEGKRAAETLCFDHARTRDAKVRVVRIFNTYGPRMAPDDGRVVSNFIVQALAAKNLTLYGEGTQTRSFQYVDDLVDGMCRVMAQDDIGPFNLGNPIEFTVRELAEKVVALAASASRIVKAPLPPDDPSRRKPDIARARALGWEPKIPLEEGLAKTIAYFRGRAAGAAPGTLS